MNDQVKARKDLNFDGLKPLMLAVSANRTRIHFGNKHVCMTHMCKVDKTHIDLCSHLKSDFKPTEFNNILFTTKLYDIDIGKLKLMHTHFSAL